MNVQLNDKQALIKSMEIKLIQFETHELSELIRWLIYECFCHSLKSRIEEIIFIDKIIIADRVKKYDYSVCDDYFRVAVCFSNAFVDVLIDLPNIEKRVTKDGQKR